MSIPFRVCLAAGYFRRVLEFVPAGLSTEVNVIATDVTYDLIQVCVIIA